MRIARVLAGLLSSLLLAAVASAASLEGVVRGDEGQPLAFAALRLTKPGVERSTLAGPDGVYRFVNLPEGAYRLRVSYVGYDAQDIEVVLGLEEMRTVDVTLDVEPVRMREIEVEADRASTERRSQTGFVKLESEQLRRIPAIVEADPIRALQLLPGVQAASDISSGLYVRGAGPDQNLLLLDRVPVYNATHAFGLFSSFNPDTIDEVTLYKGAYPARYGGRLGSILEVAQADGSDEKLHGQVGVSTIAARGRLEGPVGRGSWTLTGRRTYLDPLLNALSTPESPLPGYYFYDGGGKLVLPQGPHRWEVWGYASHDVLTLDTDDDVGLDLRWGNRLASVRHQRSLGETTVLDLVAWYSRYQSDTELEVFTTPISFLNRIEDTSASASLRWQAGRHRWDVGAVASFYRFAYQQTFNFEPDRYATEPLDAALYVEDLFDLSAVTTLRTGLRTRYVSDGDRILWEPRLSASHSLGERWTIKAGGGIYHQVLQLVTTEGFSAGDYYVPIDETVPPSRSYQGVVGAEYSPSRDWRFSAETYFTWLDDLLDFRSDGPADDDSYAAADVFRPGGRGFATGLELFAEKRLGPLTGWVGYTLGWTRRQFDGVNDGHWFSPKYDRRHDLNVVLQRSDGPWTFGANFVYGTGQAFTPAAARYAVRNPATGELQEQTLAAPRNSSRLLPYHRMDFSVTRDFTLWGKPAQWLLQVFNLYSRRNDWFVSFDEGSPGAPDVTKQLPIIPSLGLNVRF